MNILICDDHELYREGLKHLLNGYFESRNIKIIESNSIQDLYSQAECQQLSLILLDLSMPGSDGVLEISKIKIETRIPIIVISSDESFNTMQMAFRQGADGYISKGVSSDEMLSSIERVLNGERLFPDEVMFGIGGATVNLSKRHVSVLHCLVSGDSNREIANKLHLSEGTVKQYVSFILCYLDVDNRTQAAIKGAEILN